MVSFGAPNYDSIVIAQLLENKNCFCKIGRRERMRELWGEQGNQSAGEV